MRAFWLDVVFGTIFVFVIMWGLGYTFNRLPNMDPIGDAIGDVEITDIVFSRIREEPLGEDRVVLVNIGNLNREGLALQIDILSQFDPAVIGIDAEMDVNRDPRSDSIFEAAITRAGNVLIPHRLVRKNKNYWDSVHFPIERFARVTDEAYVNLITPVGEQEQFKICRSFAPKEKLEDRQVTAFGVKLAGYLEPEKVEEFLERNNSFELINFKRNIIDWHDAGLWSGKFPVLDVYDVLDTNFVADMIKDKIIIMGYLGSDLFDTSWDDKFFTPLNVQYAGKTNPDMYGAVIHANIVAMVLNEEYIDHMTENFGIILGIILCFLNVALFSLIYKRLDQWYDGLTKMIQLVEIFTIFGLVVWVFNSFSYKLELTIALVAIALAGDALEVYFGVIKNLFTTQGRRTLFRKKDVETISASSKEDIEVDHPEESSDENTTEIIESKEELNN